MRDRRSTRDNPPAVRRPRFRKLLALAAHAAFIVCAGSLVVLAAWTTRPRALDIASHAIPHAAVALTLALAIMAPFTRRRRLALLTAPLLALWICVGWSFRHSPSIFSAPRGQAVRVVAYNSLLAKSLNDEPMLRWLAAQDADFIVIVEPMPFTNAAWDTALAAYPYRVQGAPGEYLTFHLFSKTPLEPDPMLLPGDDPRRFRKITHTALKAVRTSLANGRQIRVSGVHIRSPRTPEDFDIALSQANAVATRMSAAYSRDRVPTLLAGDVNATPMGRVHRTLCSVAGLKGWSRMFGAGTWPSTLSPLISLPIDRVLTTPEFACSRIKVGPRFNSDHRPVVVDLVLRDPR
jgi:endonuclease/exonuclease/phosphatase (EEP) superfamily protein YafD